LLCGFSVNEPDLFKVRVCFWRVCCCGGEKKAVGAKKSGERLRGLLGWRVYWLAGWLAGWVCGGFCNVKWERSKTVYFDKMSANNPNKQ
jgi:hypothetical protein